MQQMNGKIGLELEKKRNTRKFIRKITGERRNEKVEN